MTRALIVDDEDDMRALLRVAIEQTGDVTVAAEAADGAEAVSLWREHRPDVVVLDQRMPTVDGLEAAGRILREDPDQPVILFSAYLTDEMRREAAALGVRECVEKDEVFRIPEVIRTHARRS